LPWRAISQETRETANKYDFPRYDDFPSSVKMKERDYNISISFDWDFPMTLHWTSRQNQLPGGN